ncbi:MAG: lipid A export permease/ATP-binding protein MsbA [bacterium]
MSSDNNISAFGVYKRLKNYMQPKYWIVLVFAIIGTAIDALGQAGFAALMKPLLDGGFVNKDAVVIAWLPWAIIGLFIFRSTGTFLYRYGMAWIGRKLVAGLRQSVFEHYLKMPAASFDESNSGELVSRVNFDAEQLSYASIEAVTIGVRDTLASIALLGYMFYLSPKLTLTVLILVPLMGGIVAAISGRLRRTSRHIQKTMGDVTRITQEVVSADRVIKVFGGAKNEKSRFNTANEKNRKLNMKVVSIAAVSNVILQLGAASVLAAVIYVGAGEAYSDASTAGGFMSFMTAMMMIIPALKKLTNITALLQKGAAAGDSMFAILDTPIETDKGQDRLDKCQGSIKFEHVTFQYSSSDSAAINDISLQVEPGQTVALVGRSGSGKSSLVNLIPRFYTHNQGKIYIDDKDIVDLGLASLRSHIALVSQEVILFNDSVANNIAYGALSECSRAQIEAAASAAYAMEFINELPEGLDTIVGDRGVRLSGGQRQRLAIARAMLKNAPILILDEATSALDTESERAIQKALNTMMQGRTTLVVAHRLSTIESADLILVLDQGKIVERGSHADLLRTQGIYAQLHALQFSHSHA